MLRRMLILFFNGIFVPLVQSHCPLCLFTKEPNLLVRNSKINYSLIFQTYLVNLNIVMAMQ